MIIARRIFRLVGLAVVIILAIAIAFPSVVAADKSSLEMVVGVGLAVILLAKVAHLIVPLVRSFKSWRDNDSADSGKLNMFCWGCGYALVGLLEPRCPECGRAFDLSDRRTFSRRPPRGAAWRWGIFVTDFLACMALVAAMQIGNSWWEWRCEQKVIADLKREFAATIDVRPMGPKWLSGRLGFLQERVVRVFAQPRQGRTTRGIDFDSLRRLESLSMYRRDLDDSMLAKLGNSTTLRSISLEDLNVNWRDLKRFARTSQLESLYLRSTNIEDSDLAYISTLKQLRVLCIVWSPITDGGLEHLKTMKGLEKIILVEAKVTPEGIARLREAIPGLNVVERP